jgi:hypothetical protein
MAHLLNLTGLFAVLALGCSCQVEVTGEHRIHADDSSKSEQKIRTLGFQLLNNPQRRK